MAAMGVLTHQPDLMQLALDLMAVLGSVIVVLAAI